MDGSERLINDFLGHRGYKDIKYEPDGNIPPDFLVDGHIAVEVRRLHKQHEAVTGPESLEQVAIPLWRGIEKLAHSFGPPRNGESWFIWHRVVRPVEWKTVMPAVRSFLNSFSQRAVRNGDRLEFDDGFYVEIIRAGTPRDHYFTMAGSTDPETSGFIVADIAKYLPDLASEKSAKIARFRSKYPEWWLAFADRIGWGLDQHDQAQLRAAIPRPKGWDKVFLVNASDPTDYFEL